MQGRSAGGKILRSRSKTATIDESILNKIKEHQKELVKQKQEEGLKRFAGEDAGAQDTGESVFKKYESYRRESQLPTKVDDLRVRLFEHESDALDYGGPPRSIGHPPNQPICSPLSCEDFEEREHIV